MPYLTPKSVEAMGVAGLTALAASPGLPIAAKLTVLALVKLVPVLEQVGPVVEGVQHLCDAWNHMFGLVSP